MAAGFRHRRFGSWIGGDHATHNALADPPKAAHGMKILAACIFVIALMLRAAPICAAPVQTATEAMMADCEGAPGHHDGQSGQKGDDAGRSCHACAFSLETNAVLIQPERVVAFQHLVTAAQFAGSALKPPTPPPRLSPLFMLSTFNWS